MSSKEMFGEAFRRFGYPTEPPDIDPNSYNIPYDVTCLLPEIYCDFIESKAFNAVGCFYNGREFVAFFTGLVNFMVPYYATILSDPLMFTDIGEPSKENIEMNLEIRKKHPDSVLAGLPRCPIRSAAFEHLSWCSHLWLHAHELAHIVLGHLDLMSSEFGLSVYEELPIIDLSAEESMLRKVLELQADQSAALTSLHLFRRRVESDPRIKGVLDADYLWSIAVEMLLVLFELVSVRKGHRTSNTHPSPMIRWMNVKLNVYEHAIHSGIPNITFDPEKNVLKQTVNWLETRGLMETGILLERTK
jgi:hypothetical protein